MQKRIVVNRGRRYQINVATDDGVGAGFAIGQLTLKSITDKYWYIVTASGSAANATASVSASRLDYFGTSSYYDLNYPYQLLASTNGNSYAVYLQGSGSGATLVISQSAYTGSSYPKPYLLLQSISDGNYYQAYLSSSGGVTSLVTNPYLISQSFITPIY